MHETVNPREKKIEVRWGLEEDEVRIAELMELNGTRRSLACEERFIVAAAKPGGKVLAALCYRTEPKRLLLGLLVSDPWAQERPLAVALYAGAGELAREMGAREVRVRSVPHAGDYPYEAGYRRRFPGGWYLDAPRPHYRCRELPPGGWRRMVALLDVLTVPSFFTAETKSHVAAGAQVDRLIGELEDEFDLLRLRGLKAGLDREEERLAEEERLSRERLRPADATAAGSSVMPADGGVGKGAWWRVLSGRVALWRRVWWIRIRRGTLVQEWWRLSLLEREIEFAMRERRSRTPR